MRWPRSTRRRGVALSGTSSGGLVVDLHVAGVRARLARFELQAVERRPNPRPGTRSIEKWRCARDPLVELGDQLVVRPVLDALGEPVGRHDLDLDLGHHAEHADRDLGGARGRSGRRLVDLDDLARAGRRSGSAAAPPRSSAGGCRSRASPCRSRRRCPACRCRPGSRARGRRPTAARRSSPIGRAGQRRDPAPGGVDRGDPLQARRGRSACRP